MEAIVENEFSEYSGHSEGQELAASKSAEITEQIAIDFHDFMMKIRYDSSGKYLYILKLTTIKEQFQEFLKSKENDKS